MKLIVALTGREWPINTDILSFVDLQEKIFDITLVPPQHQILLSDTAHTITGIIPPKTKQNIFDPNSPAPALSNSSLNNGKEFINIDDNSYINKNNSNNSSLNKELDGSISATSSNTVILVNSPSRGGSSSEDYNNGNNGNSNIYQPKENIFEKDKINLNINSNINNKILENDNNDITDTNLEGELNLNPFFCSINQNDLVFLFDKRLLRVEDRIFTIGEPEIIPSPNSKTALINKAIGYKEAFESHTNFIDSIAKSCNIHVNFMKRTIDEVQNEIKAFQAAFSNLNIYIETLRSSWFNLKFISEPEFNEYKSILDSFNKDIEILNKIPVNKNVINLLDKHIDNNENDNDNINLDINEEKTLKDFISVENLNKWHQKCFNLLSDFQRKIEWTDKEIGNIAHMAGDTSEVISGSKFPSDVKVSNDHIQSRCNRIKNDYNKVVDILEKSNKKYESQGIYGRYGGKYGSYNLNGDEKIAIEDLLVVHLEDFIPKIEKMDSLIRDRAYEIWSDKVRVTDEVHDRIIRICQLQSRIGSVVNVMVKIGALRIVLSEAFKQLIRLQKLPFVYTKCIRETLRRKSVLENMAFEIWKFNRKLKDMRDKELDNQHTFNEIIGDLLPDHIFEIYKSNKKLSKNKDNYGENNDINNDDNDNELYNYSFKQNYSDLIDISSNFMNDIEYGNSILPKFSKSDLYNIDKILELYNGGGVEIANLH